MKRSVEYCFIKRYEYSSEKQACRSRLCKLFRLEQVSGVSVFDTINHLSFSRGLHIVALRYSTNGTYILPKDTSTCRTGESNQRPSSVKMLALLLSHSCPYTEVIQSFEPKLWSIQRCWRCFGDCIMIRRGFTCTEVK